MLKFKLARPAFATILTTIALGLVAGQALATQSNPCLIYDAKLSSNPTRLTFHCVNDDNHYTAGLSGCGTANTDQIKLWHAQVMAAMLSGKTSVIYYSSPSGCNGNKAVDEVLTTAQ